MQVFLDGSRRVSGVLSCGSVWACPVCAQRICSCRADELCSVLAEYTRRGSGHAYLLTLTVRHHKGNNLSEQRQGLADAWRRANQGKRQKTLRRLLHLEHFVRALEVTHGHNGWHSHLHILLLCERAPEPETLDYLRPLWIDAVSKELDDSCAPDWEHGVDLRPTSAAAYLAKLGLEVSGVPSTKQARASRTPWQLAADAATRDERSVALWREYCRDMKGARQLTWSRGMRRHFGLAQRDSDADVLAALEAAEADEMRRAGRVLVEWDGASWDYQARNDPFWVSRVSTHTGPSSALPGQRTGPGAPELAPDADALALCEAALGGNS